MIRIAKIADGEFCVKEIEKGLEPLQKEVGGSGIITLCPYYDELEEMGIDIYADDNGMLVETPRLSLVSVDKTTNEIEHGIFGNVIFVSHDNEGGAVSLSDEQIAFIKKHLQIAFIKNYLRMDGHGHWMKCYEFGFGDEADDQIIDKLRTGDWE